MSTTVASQGTVCARVAQRLAQSVGNHRYNMWFDRSARLGWDEQQRRLDVSVPNRFVADWIDRNFQTELWRALRHELGEDVDLKVRVDPQGFQHPSPDRSSADRHARLDGAERTATKAPRSRRRQTDQSLRYKLDEFVVGPSNELAFAAANRLIERDGDIANPLFIHGGCGLGKTHLLQGICSQLLQRKAGSRVLYTTGEQFTNDFVNAVRSNKVEPFRRRVRALDLLAVDDVHFLSAKPATQLQFLHSFDAIELNGARVVMAGDCHPKRIDQFSKALVSRCVHGMVVQIHQPDTQTRIRIIRALAQRRGISLLETVVAVLASNCQGSVREIEGTLTKLHAIAELAQHRQGGVNSDAEKHPPGTVADRDMGRARSMENSGQGRQHPSCQPIGHAMLSRLLSADSALTDRTTVVRVDSILAAVTQRVQVSREQILGRGRERMVVIARALTVFLARQLTEMSYPEIAAALGRSSHSTVIAADRRVRKQLAENIRVVLPDSMQEITIASLIEQLKEAIDES